jgi:hypothetical protein
VVAVDDGYSGKVFGETRMSVPTDPVKLAAYRELMRKIKTGTKHTEKAKEKIRLANTGRIFSKEHCGRISKSKMGHLPWNKGVPMPPEQKKILSEKAKQRGYVGERNPSWKPKIKRECPICNLIFEVIPYLAKTRKYCSMACYNKNKKGEQNPHFGKKHTEEAKKIMSDAVKTRGQVGEKHPNYKPKIKKECPICHRIFEVRPSHSYQEFCSQKCKGIWQSFTQVGERNPAWAGGTSFEPYCILFNDEFKERVRIWFGYTCVECGTPQNGRRHCVHHVNYDKETCCHDGEPLFVCLCNKCNLAANNNRPYWEQHFAEWIHGYYGNKCYLSKEEMKAYTGVVA